MSNRPGFALKLAVVGMMAHQILGTTAAAAVYESRAVVQVRSIAARPDAQAPAGKADIERAITTEITSIASDQTLNLVIQRLDLDSRWELHPKRALAHLKTVVTAKRVKGTNLIAISARSQEAKEAQQLCETVVNTYRERRQEEEGARLEKALGVLEAEMGTQKDLVEAKRKLLLGLIGKVAEEGENQADHKAGYKAARKDYEQATGELEAQKVRFSAKLVHLKTPKVPVTIHERASLPTRPVKK